MRSLPKTAVLLHNVRSSVMIVWDKAHCGRVISTTRVSRGPADLPTTLRVLRSGYVLWRRHLIVTGRTNSVQSAGRQQLIHRMSTCLSTN